MSKKIFTWILFPFASSFKCLQKKLHKLLQLPNCSGSLKLFSFSISYSVWAAKKLSPQFIPFSSLWLQLKTWQFCFSSPSGCYSQVLLINNCIGSLSKFHTSSCCTHLSVESWLLEADRHLFIWASKCLNRSLQETYTKNEQKAVFLLTGYSWTGWQSIFLVHLASAVAKESKFCFS